MREDFLHYVWKFKKFDSHKLITVTGEPIVLINVGQHNLNAGPDFFNAQLKIGDQLWAGNVEIHLKASDWYVHHHEMNPAYDNVILHVVWEYDTDVFRKDHTVIPVMELKSIVFQSALKGYNTLFLQPRKWINCENDLGVIDEFLFQNWLERLYFERLEDKSRKIESMLQVSKHDWEAVLFKLLAKNFGLKVNGEAFLSMASSFEFGIVRKIQNNQNQLEALFFGQSGLLDVLDDEAYLLELQQEYAFLKQKFDLENKQVIPVQFFRLRPLNFPVIRLSQLAGLYAKEAHLFSKIIEAKNVKALYDIFTVTTSSFWETHYTFKKTSKFVVKKTTKSFIDLLIINTVLPIKFYYATYTGKCIDKDLLNIIRSLSAEKNAVTEKFKTLRMFENSAMHSQALIQLKTEYCSKHKCLQCAIGNAVLKQA